jgi:hypothetical protein
VVVVASRRDVLQVAASGIRGTSARVIRGVDPHADADKRRDYCRKRVVTCQNDPGDVHAESDEDRCNLAPAVDFEQRVVDLLFGHTNPESGYPFNCSGSREYTVRRIARDHREPDA